MANPTDLPVCKLIFIVGTDTAQVDAARYNLVRVHGALDPMGFKATVVEGRTILFVEHPVCAEHPRDQAKWLRSELAVLMAPEAQTASMVIRTHSEVLINLAGELIEDAQVLTKADVAVVFCEDGETRVCRFDERGYVQNWPVGYFSP